MAVKRIPPDDGLVVGDRWLGREWVDWTGEGAERVEVGKGVFLSCAGLGMALALGLGLVALYMVEPRLSQLPPPIHLGAVAAAVASLALAAVWFVSVVLSSMAERRIGMPLLGFHRGMSLLYSLASLAARRVGVSRDRLGGSFIQVCNGLIRARGPLGPCRRLLILAPRCLTRGLKDRMDALARQYGCEIRTVGGGGMARRAIAEAKPTAVVGIACERDLVNGIRDVYPLLPVLAVPNFRPKGPCKETVVDLDAVEEAVRFFADPAAGRTCRSVERRTRSSRSARSGAAGDRAQSL